MTGYSLGGLISRYVVGCVDLEALGLHRIVLLIVQKSILHQRGFFENVIPINFNTVATPHIGLLRYRGFMSKVFAYFGPKLLSRTGEQFYAVRTSSFLLRLSRCSLCTVFDR